MVLRLAGHDVAQVSAWTDHGLIHVEHVHMLSAHRRQGYASRLLQALFAHFPGWTFALCAAAFEFPGLTAEHPPPDTEALTAWYTRLGFREADDGRLHHTPDQGIRPLVA
ncbi:GNAT family N-acetyltransferase [Lentzea sp. CA-135723]|uniref:GNAT family N-acetyltransferase n=1 Tax=Lentzea sp. CA-135723 TaxID=3239950 RepID=UPI003D8F33C2